MRKVFIEGPAFQYEPMWVAEGWKVVHNFLHADLIQFTGGADVNPELYGELQLSKTHCNTARDVKEQVIFKMALAQNKPMAGICRGGQFLNVMCGGRLYQDVDNHAIQGTHEVTDVETDETFQVTSTHHQMMVEGKEGVPILTASESTRKERNNRRAGNTLTVFVGTEKKNDDLEAVFYPRTNVFCFQPHPEFANHDELRHRYVSYVERYLFGVENKPVNVTA